MTGNKGAGNGGSATKPATAAYKVTTGSGGSGSSGGIGGNGGSVDSNNDNRNVHVIIHNHHTVTEEEKTCGDNLVTSKTETTVRQTIKVQRSKVNFVVAFGRSADTYYISAGSKSSYNNLPDGMKTILKGDLEHPIQYASIGPNGQYFVRGKKAGESGRISWYWHAESKMLQTRLKLLTSPRGLTFGSDDAWITHDYHDEHFDHHWHGLDENQLAWFKKQRTKYGNQYEPFLGPGSCLVLLFADRTLTYTNCGTKLSDTLDVAKKIGLKVRTVALSAIERNWFFLQFTDSSICFSAPEKMADRLNHLARISDTTIRQPKTLKV
jgi:hypothetical protein